MSNQTIKHHTTAKERMESIVRLIPEFVPYHGKENDLYRRFSEITESYFTDFEGDVIDIAPVDGLVWPHTSLGNLTSYNFFCSFDEWLLYSFYWVNRGRYRKVMDIGANIGVGLFAANIAAWPEVTKSVKQGQDVYKGLKFAPVLCQRVLF